MSSRFINNGSYAASGYTLSGVFQSITIGAEGTIGGPGIIGGTKEAYTIVNRGRVTGSKDGIDLSDGGVITNAGTISATATSGVGVRVIHGGVVTNSKGALIGGGGGVYLGGGATVVNAGTIAASADGSYGFGVHRTYDVKAEGPGTIVNTSSGLILETGEFGVAVFLQSGSINNGGTILGKDDNTIGITIIGKGVISNAAGGLIEAGDGIYDEKGTITLTNAGTIIGNYPGGMIGGPGTPQVVNGFGVGAEAGVITNTANGIIEAIGETAYGVEITGRGTVRNAGLIKSDQSGVFIGSGSIVNRAGAIIESAGPSYGEGILVGSGGQVTTSTIINGPGALIAGYDGIVARYNTTIVNSGTIETNQTTGTGINLENGGSITDTSLGLIEGAGHGEGVYLSGDGSLSNSGTIIGGSYRSAAGVRSSTDGGIIGNHAGGLIEGPTGVDNSGGTVANAGTILGTANSGVDFTIGGLLTNAAHALIEGVIGLEFNSEEAEDSSPFTLINDGTIASSSGVAGTAVVLGAVALSFLTEELVDEAGSTFIGKVIGGGGTLALAGLGGTLSGLGTSFSGFGTVEVLAGADWTLSGTDSIAAGEIVTVANGATLAVSGNVSGSGTLVFDGTETLAAGAAFSVADMTLSRGIATLAASVSDDGNFTEAAGTLALPAGDTLTLAGTARFSGGTVAGPGVLDTTGSVTLAGLVLDGDGIWDASGSVTETGALTFGSAGGGAGHLAILAGSDFDLTGNADIRMAVGGKGSTVNQGVLEKTGTGLSVVRGFFTNTGTIVVNAGAGTLDFSGTIFGTGKAMIGAAATLDFGNAVPTTETVTFAGSSATLLLTDATAFKAAIDGFDAGASGDKLDVEGFDAGTRVTFTQPGSGETVATLTDGKTSAAVSLFGQYSAAGFGYTAGSAGTVITYTAPPADVTLAGATSSSHR